MQKSRSPVIIGIDPGLTRSGWAVFCLRSIRPLSSGSIKPLGPQFPLPDRLVDLQGQVELLLREIDVKNTDYLVCEGAAHLMQNPKTSALVEQVRTIFETVARSRRIVVPGRINPRTLQVELLGLKGAQLPRDQVKKLAEEYTKIYFQSYLEALDRKVNSDENDALLIGFLACSKVSRALKTSQDPLLQFTQSWNQSKGSNRSKLRQKWTSYIS